MNAGSTLLYLEVINLTKRISISAAEVPFRENIKSRSSRGDENLLLYSAIIFLLRVIKMLLLSAFGNIDTPTSFFTIRGLNPLSSYLSGKTFSVFDIETNLILPHNDWL